MTVPPGKQCTASDCERGAVNPQRPGALCQFHHPDHETPEPVTKPETSEVSEHSQNTDTGLFQDADFTDPTPGVWPPELLSLAQWMGHVEKKPFALWGDRNAPAPCNKDGHTTADVCGCDARWKWGYQEHYVTGKTIAMAEDDPRLDGRAFLQQPDDPYAYVDGDDVRDPETGTVHPAFEAILEHLGLTYADVSTSGTGVHAVYRGRLPDGVKQAAWQLDTEPWVGDDNPSIEIYPGKRVCVMTGDHVPGTPTEIREWNASVLEPLLEANDEVATSQRDARPSTDPEDYDLADYTPSATTSNETTDDIRDVFAALDRLDAQRVADRTIVHAWNDDASTSAGYRAFQPTWGRNSNGTANIVNDQIWQDTGDQGGYGGPVVMALIHAGEMQPSNATPRNATGGLWFQGVDHLRSLGFPIPRLKQPPSESEAEPVAALPIGRLDALQPEERRRYATKRGLTWPDTDDARDRLQDAIVRELAAGNTTVLDAPTALGKSYTVASEPWRRHTSVTGDAPVIHLHATRDARDEANAHTTASAATGAVLYGRKESCPLAAGSHDPVDDPDEETPGPDVPVTVNGRLASAFFDHLCDEKGLPFSTAHALARDCNDQGLEELPCRETGECPAIQQWEGIPRDDDGNPAVDVVHATHQFAYVPSLRHHTNVVLDEQPDYTMDLAQDRIRRMVNAYLREIDAPATTWEALVTLAKHRGTEGDAARERDALNDMMGQTPSREWYVEDPDAHALAPDLTRAIWRALRWEDPDANGRRSTKVMHEPPRLDTDAEGYAGTWLSIVIDAENTVRSVRNVPDFSQARAVIGLDAHPSMPMWHLNAGPDLTQEAVLEPTERRLWRRYERGLTIVQIGTATRPRSGSKALEWMNQDRVTAVINRIQEHTAGDLTTAITTRQVEGALTSLLATHANTPETMHYGEEKSRNDFATESVGYLYGCMDPGDEMILDALAELDLDATPATAQTTTGETVREKGRTFVGPDQETAAAVLASVRENHVAQGAGRYARHPDTPESGATVYLHTNAAPTGFVDIETPGVEWLATDTQRAIIDELTAQPSATTRDLADAVGCTKEHVRSTLAELTDQGLVSRHTGVGDHGADIYRDHGVTGALVDLGETTNDPLQDSNRWTLAIRDPSRAANDSSPSPGGDSGVAVVVDRGDRPPDDPA